MPGGAVGGYSACGSAGADGGPGCRHREGGGRVGARAGGHLCSGCCAIGLCSATAFRDEHKKRKKQVIKSAKKISTQANQRSPPVIDFANGDRMRMRGAFWTKPYPSLTRARGTGFKADATRHDGGYTL